MHAWSMAVKVFFAEFNQNLKQTKTETEQLSLLTTLLFDVQADNYNNHNAQICMIIKH